MTGAGDIRIGRPHATRVSSRTAPATDVRAENSPTRRRAALVSLLIWIVVPSAWLLTVGLLGPLLSKEHAAVLTVFLWLLLLFGMPATMFLLARRLLGAQIRLRRTTTASAWRPRPQQAAAWSRHAVTDARARLVAGGLLAAIGVEMLAMWVGAPLLSLWVFSQLLDSTTPTMWPYVAMAVTIPASMFAVLALVVRTAALRDRVLGAQDREVRTKWLRSLRDDRAQPNDTRAVDAVAVVAVLSSILALVVWVFALSDPSQMLPPELRGAG